MNVGLLLIIVLLILVLGGLPGLGLHSYGHWPSGGAGLLLLVVIVVLVAGRGRL